MLQKVFQDVLPNRYTVSSGLALSSSGEFSNQADMFIVDGLSNRPLIDGSVPIWLIESIYALLEIKTYLGPTEIKDSLQKCARFKKLTRKYSDRIDQSIDDSLFVLWSYDSPSVETCLDNIATASKLIDADLLPDFIISPMKFVVTAGQYHCLAKYGAERSDYRIRFEATGGKMEKRSFRAYKSDENCFMMFFIWLLSWLDRAGPRSPDLVGYIPEGRIIGESREGIFRG